MIQYRTACFAPVETTACTTPVFSTAETTSSPVGPTILKLDGSRAFPAGGRSNVRRTRCSLTPLTAVSRADPPPSPRASSSWSNQLAPAGATGSSPTSTTIDRPNDTARRLLRAGLPPRRDPPMTIPLIDAGQCPRAPSDARRAVSETRRPLPSLDQGLLAPSPGIASGWDRSGQRDGGARSVLITAMKSTQPQNAVPCSSSSPPMRPWGGSPGSMDNQRRTTVVSGSLRMAPTLGHDVGRGNPTQW